jgi:hypothetical protein
MKSPWLAMMVVLILSLAFWAVASLSAGVAEPWDAESFWRLMYPGALALSAVAGLLFPQRSMVWGAVVMFAQIPLVMLFSGAGPLLAVGVLYAAVLSVPAMALSWLAGVARRRLRTA